MTVTETDRVANVANAVETSDRVASHLHPEGSWRVEDHPVPTGLEEIWRFTPLKRLRGLHADAPFGTGSVRTESSAPDGVSVRAVEGAEAADWRGISGFVPTDRASARVFAETAASLVVDVPAEAEPTEPVVLRLSGEGAQTAEAGHVAVRVGAHARVTVVLNHTGSAQLAQVVEFAVGDGAQVTVVTVQDWADDAVHLAQHQARVGRDASLKHVAVSFGGDLVRLNSAVSYAGPGGNAELLGLYFADAGQHLEHRLFVDHNAPHTISNVDYKGALQGRGAHTVWIGDVLIRKVAEGIETYESNRNLVLTDGCRADAVPNLEIETGDIAGAGHAATTGRFDDEQLFYLRSRGIAEDEARRLVVHGFFADIIRRIGVADVEERLLTAVEHELAVNIGLPTASAAGAGADA
ncbi:Fe-S cluster assembly protein SufD [Friedmanniella endophytica]|uniref:Fe-S cluster assembly protein SufD n=1 Tax=Microlunatus kandeliicorticis TaxID=1759536 RepID=A0A7W3IS63_9ACTN|nr:Fe-S cluster assembly protein SufD [Microlunatus kandeliicorticis]MBA8794240.1 Fe-S cluster assembly protein SufD [Microlunatus kandeliicorticis]